VVRIEVFVAICIEGVVVAVRPFLVASSALRIRIRVLTTIQLARLHAFIKCRIAHGSLSLAVSNEASIAIATSARNQICTLLERVSTTDSVCRAEKPFHG
jgi:hypothetical protein